MRLTKADLLKEAKLCEETAEERRKEGRPAPAAKWMSRAGTMLEIANHPDLAAYEKQAQDIKELRQDLLDATNILISCGANRQDIARYQALLDRTKPTYQG